MLAQAADTAPDDAGMSMLDFVRAGGTVGYVIILLSVVAVAFAVVLAIQIRASSLAPEHVIDGLSKLVKDRQIDRAIAFCDEDANQCFLGNIMSAGLTRYQRSPFGALELKSALEEAGTEQVARLYRWTDALALIASIAPMLGLLGTVVGINGAFSTISRSQGFARPDQLAGDIALALVTTIMGLVLAIPATAAVTFFRNRIDALASDVAAIADDIASHLEEAPATTHQPRRPAAPQPTTAPGMGAGGGSGGVVGGGGGGGGGGGAPR